MPVPQSLLCLAQQAPADLLGQPLPLLLTLLDQLGQQLQEEQRQRGQARPPSALPPACPSPTASPWAPLPPAVGGSAAARPQGVPAAASGPPPAVHVWGARVHTRVSKGGAWAPGLCVGIEVRQTLFLSKEAKVPGAM